MSENKELQPLPEKDYHAIESAVMESARGRWFLAEYAQRNRHADTLMLLEAIRKIETNFKPAGPGTEPDVDKVKFDLMEMASAIAQTKNEIAAITTNDQDDSRIFSATQELDAIVIATETATSDILGAAENIQEIAWTMREKGADDEYCDALDDRTTEIYTACSFQDITGQRITKVVDVLKYLENRLNAMIDIWGGDNIAAAPPPDMDTRSDAHLLNGPQLEGNGNDQDDIDLMFVESGNAPASGNDERTREATGKQGANKDGHREHEHSKDDLAQATFEAAPDNQDLGDIHADDIEEISSKDAAASPPPAQIEEPAAASNQDTDTLPISEAAAILDTSPPDDPSAEFAARLLQQSGDPEGNGHSAAGTTAEDEFEASFEEATESALALNAMPDPGLPMSAGPKSADPLIISRDGEDDAAETIEPEALTALDQDDKLALFT